VNFACRQFARALSGSLPQAREIIAKNIAFQTVTKPESSPKAGEISDF
jgi:hypothetical protein